MIGLMMSRSIRDVAADLVNLVLKYETLWGSDEKLAGKLILTEKEIETFFGTVHMAGFRPKEMVLGRLYGPRPVTKEMYPLNVLCPLKVIGLDGKDHLHATEWLDNELGRIIVKKRNDEKCVEEIVDEIVIEIERMQKRLVRV